MSEKQVQKFYKVTEEAIYGFFKDHRFLSNFHLCTVEYEGLTYFSSEAAFQAAKIYYDDPIQTKNERLPFTNYIPSQAKKEGEKVKLRDKWDLLKASFMYEICTTKFQSHPDLLEKLLATGDKYLEETNWWHDTYWGTDNTHKGLNVLGHILMQIRTNFQT